MFIDLSCLSGIVVRQSLLPVYVDTGNGGLILQSL